MYGFIIHGNSGYAGSLRIKKGTETFTLLMLFWDQNSHLVILVQFRDGQNTRIVHRSRPTNGYPVADEKACLLGEWTSIVTVIKYHNAKPVEPFV